MVNLAEKFDWKIKKATIKTLSRAIMFFSLLLMAESMTLAETRIGDQVLLTRESIVRNMKKEVILKNKNIDFKATDLSSTLKTLKKSLQSRKGINNATHQAIKPAKFMWAKYVCNHYTIRSDVLPSALNGNF